MGAFIDAHDRLRNIGKPTIARLNGIVVGGGNEFNIACDLAVAADDITIRQVGRRAAACRPAARRSGCRSSSATGARARSCCSRSRSRPPRRWPGGWSTRWCRAPSSTRRSTTMAGKLLNKLPTIMRYTKQQTQLLARLLTGTDRRPRARLAERPLRLGGSGRGAGRVPQPPPGRCSRLAPGAGGGGRRGRLDLRGLRQPRAAHFRLLRPLRCSEAEC